MPGNIVDNLTKNLRFQAQPFFDQTPPNPLHNPLDPLLFSECQPRPYHLSANVAPPNPWRLDRTAAMGLGPDPSMSFCWLPYVGGRITWTALANLTILTGKMSGCWLVLCRIRGQVALAHIGTDSNNPTVNDAVKNAWKIGVGRGLVQPLRAFKPSDEVGPSLGVLGAVTPAQQLWAIDLETDPAVGTVYGVRRVKHVPGLPAPRFT